MRKSFLFLLLVSLGLLGVSGCSSSSSSDAPVPSRAAPQHSILGTWAYTLFAESEGSTYEYDNGFIKYQGTETRGTFTLINFYEIEYSGDYAVDGEGVTITGSQTWVGVFTDATHMDGTWEAGDSEATGTWTAIKQ